MFTIVSYADPASPLLRVEHEDNYHELLAACPFDTNSRKGTLYQPANPYVLASLTTLTFPWDEGMRHFQSTSVSVLLLHPSAEHGRPHTRGQNTICIPETPNWTSASIQTMLHHKAVHLSQKQYPDIWKQALAEAWECHWIDRPMEEMRSYWAHFG
jgi:hypothetical protein